MSLSPEMLRVRKDILCGKYDYMKCICGDVRTTLQQWINQFGLDMTLDLLDRVCDKCNQCCATQPGTTTTTQTSTPTTPVSYTTPTGSCSTGIPAQGSKT